MPTVSQLQQERVERLMRALYREELRTAAYRAYRRRVKAVPVRTMLTTFLRVQERVVRLLEEHLLELGVGTPGRRGPLRRLTAATGAFLATVASVGGDLAILRRIRSEETRGADRSGREVDWEGWSAAERDSFDGHRCDQLYQNQWAQDVARDLQRGGTGAVDRPT